MRVWIFPMILLVLPLMGSQQPEDSAMAFLAKLRAGNLDLAPLRDTAISEGTSVAKRQRIAQRLDVVSAMIRGCRMEPGPTRIEGDLAGVILREAESDDPSRVRVLSLAMVRDGGVWRASPLPASFENTAVAHARTDGERARAMELWLAREQVSEIERLRKSAEERLRQFFGQSIAEKDLREMDVSRLAEMFFQACETRDERMLLALSGGLSRPLPDNWPAVSAGIRDAMAGPDVAEGAWHSLITPKMLRVCLVDPPQQANDLPIRLVCMDPLPGTTDRWKRIDLPFQRNTEGLWQIGIPGERKVDESDLNSFTASFVASARTRPRASAAELSTALMEAMGGRSATAWKSLVRFDGDIHGLRECIQRAAGFWAQGNDLHNPKILVEIGRLEQPDQVCLLLQWFAIRGGDPAPSAILHLERTEHGWLWNPMPDGSRVAQAETWALPWFVGARDKAMDALMGHCSRLDPQAHAPEEAAASDVVRDFTAALAELRWVDALRLCAQLGTPKSPVLLLRNFGHECHARSDSQGGGVVISAVRGKHITLVRVLRGGSTTQRSVTVLPVVQVPGEGARILMETDLGDPSRPGRAFLNRQSISHLKHIHPLAAEELPSLMDALISPQAGEKRVLPEVRVDH